MQDTNHFFIDLNEIINNAIEGILIIQNGFIKDMNQSLLDILGYENKADLIGNLATGILIPTSKEKYIKYNSKIFQEIAIITKNGDVIPVIIKIKDINFSNQEYKMVSILDLSELKEKEKMMLLQSKHSAMGEMISMIAHQWRQPLQAVSILIQKLPLLKMVDGEISDELLEDVVCQVGSQLDYMSKTIDDFRDYFKPNKKKEKVYIKNVIEKSMDFLGYLFKLNSIKINYQNSSISSLKIYLNELVQVFVNLIKNSSDAMLENNIENRVINISSYENENYLFIEFEDNAGGIKNDVITKIFDPYFSTKSNKNGTGLGLYMSKTIIEEHSGGKINVYNTDFGTKFVIKLPLK